jgi:pyruvate formate lyase activating enzyme
MTNGRPEPTALIFDVMRFATHDGPGIRTVVFFKGCPLACAWCHNPESQDYQPDVLYYPDRCRHCGECAQNCPESAIEFREGMPFTTDACTRCGHCTEFCVAEARRIAGRRVTLSELLREIERDLVFLEESHGGVTLSGGEPVSQPRFAAALLRACRERGLRTALETSGFAPPESFLEVAPLADLVLFDLKLMDPGRHREFAGTWNARIHQNLEALIALGGAVTVRIPVVPGVNDTADELMRMTRYLGRIRPKKIELLPYHAAGSGKYGRLGWTYRLAGTPEPTPEDMNRFAAAFVQDGLDVHIGA